MFMKPKHTTLQKKALLYRRFIQINKSMGTATLYRTTSNGVYWLFDQEQMSFILATGSDFANSIITDVEDFKTILQYMGKYFQFNGVAWQEIENVEESVTLLSASFNQIAKYQTNAYYFAGSFDYVQRGSVDETTTQYIKGNIMPLRSLAIKHYNDDIHLSADDLVVINNHLYSVEDPQEDHKHQPNDYKIYFATLNCIL